MIDPVEKSSNVCIQHKAHLLPRDSHVQRIQRLMLTTSWPEAIGETPKILLINLIEDFDYSMLDDLVLQRCDPQWPLPTIGFRDIHSPGWLRSISAAVNPTVQITKTTFRGEVIGVLGLMSGRGWFSTQEGELLTGFLGQSALAIEHGILEQRMRRLRFLDESDRLQTALLTAVSHEVRAPIAAITAAISGLMSAATPLDQQLEQQLLRTADSETKRLHRLMNNLLNVTRLQVGMSR